MILDDLVASARELTEERRRSTPVEQLREMAADRRPPLDMVAALRSPGVSIIAEVKRASPSKGVMNATLDPASQAVRYAQGGAAAISVLTEPTRFGGCLDDLATARDALDELGLSVPLLRKDFVIDSYQVAEARAYGADSVLLIVAALHDGRLRGLHEEIMALGMTPLVEVHNAQELARAVRVQPVLLGINNRDLKTFHVDLATTYALRDAAPADCCLVSESGIHSAEQIRSLAAARVDAVLIGEALVTAVDTDAKLRELMEAGR